MIDANHRVRRLHIDLQNMDADVIDADAAMTRLTRIFRAVETVSICLPECEEASRAATDVHRGLRPRRLHGWSH